LKLIETDSICLKIWLENYRTQKDLNIYTVLAWVNYDWYNEKWEKIARWTKLLNCYESIIQLIDNNKINSNNYNYLINFIKPVNELKTKNDKINFIHKYVTHWYKVLFEIK
jgi:hypothetical protein